MYEGKQLPLSLWLVDRTRPATEYRLRIASKVCSSGILGDWKEALLFSVLNRGGPEVIKIDPLFSISICVFFPD